MNERSKICVTVALVAGLVAAFLFVDDLNAQNMLDFRDTVRKAEASIVSVIVEPGTEMLPQHAESDANAETLNEDNEGDAPPPKLQLKELEPFPPNANANPNLAVPIRRARDLNSAAFAASENVVLAYVEQPVAHVKVVTNEGEELDGRVVAFDYVTGLAAIEVEDVVLVPLVISVAPAEPGLPVVAVHRDTRTIRVTAGTVATSKIPRESGVGPVPEIHFLATPNVPGTPVLDHQGIVVGILVPSQSGGLVCSDASTAMRLLNAADAPVPQVLKRGLVGIQFESSGTLVLEVSSNSAAERAGLRAGDLVEQVGDQPVRTSTDVIAAVEMARSGETIDVVVSRDGERKSFPVTLQEHPQQWLPPSDGLSESARQIFRLENGRITPIPEDDLRRFEQFDQMFRNFDVPQLRGWRQLPPVEDPGDGPDESLEELRRQMEQLRQR
ncbi:S1C family serine protease [Roseiconus lacunae]|uniref:S1C family serine protease n=1 Tax=Roseiconus lacunae TaxID=2605694 RepID=UPI00308DD310|nr:S1C family serine protease [Stieleria sp. HD01]